MLKINSLKKRVQKKVKKTNKSLKSDDIFLFLQFFDIIYTEMKAKGAIVFRGIFYCFLALLFGITLAKGMFGGDIKSLCIAVVCLAGVGIYLLVRKKWKVLLVLFAFFFAGNGLFFAGIAVWGGNDYADTVAIVGRVR